MRALQRISVVALVGLALAGCSIGDHFEGSGAVTKETRQVSGFQRIKLEGSGDVIIERAGSESLTIEADEKLQSHITARVENDTLILGIDDNVRLWPSDEIIYHVTADDLDGMTVVGSGTIKADDVDSQSMDISIEGSGGIRLAGKVESQVVSVNGSGSYDGAALKSAAAKVSVEGSGNAEVSASESLDATIEGSGDITYDGNPQITRHINGSGGLQQR